MKILRNLVECGYILAVIYFVLDTVNFLMKIKLLEFDSKDYQRYVTKDIYIIFV